MSTLAAVGVDQINIFCFVLTPDYKMISQHACLLLTLQHRSGVTDGRGDVLLGQQKTRKHKQRGRRTNTHSI